MASPSPIAAASAALAWFFEASPPSVQNARRYSAKYSAGPNRKATRARMGASSMSPMVARSAPTKDATPDSTSASPARPCRAMGYPSRVVISAGSSPGMFSRIDEIRPPYMAP